MLNRIIMLLVKIKLKQVRKTQGTPYLFISGNAKDYPNYLMFTDDIEIRGQMKDIY